MQQHDQEPCARLARARGARWHAGTHFPSERASLCHAHTGNLRMPLAAAQSPGNPPIHIGVILPMCKYGANMAICRARYVFADGGASRDAPSQNSGFPLRCHCQDHEAAPEPRPHHHRQHLRSEIGQARASLRIIRGHRRRSGLTTFP